ncbi:unnamed protein product [Brugia pahangi]|uniref:Uncharacterized protein n=1 Tax=Brugia pahangi TaxID=6280 RepID=A0A0N4TYP0_BRUPA|nr:unnamed protein product [Brugia pahangi]
MHFFFPNNLGTTYVAENLSAISPTVSVSSICHPRSQHQQQKQQSQYKLAIGNNAVITNDAIDTDNAIQQTVIPSSAVLTSSGINSDRRVFFQDELSTTAGPISTTEVCDYQSLSVTVKNIPDIGDVYCEQQKRFLHYFFIFDRSSRSIIDVNLE